MKLGIKRDEFETHSALIKCEAISEVYLNPTHLETQLSDPKSVCE